MSMKKYPGWRRFAAMVFATVMCMAPAATAWAQSSGGTGTGSGSGSSSSSGGETIYSAMDQIQGSSRLGNEITTLSSQFLDNTIADGTQRSVLTAESILKDRLSTLGQSTDTTGTTTGTGSGTPLNSGGTSGTLNQGTASAIDEATSMYAPKLVVSFTLPTTRERAVQTAKNRSTRMKTTPNLSRLNEIEIVMKDSEATLRGRVTTPRDRTLVERIIMFEPGVRRVKNELVVDEKLAALDPLWAGVNGDFDQLPSIEAVRESRLARQSRLVVEQKKSSERGTPKIASPSAPL